MNNLFTGSICLSDLINKAQSKHSAFTKAQNGKIYVNVAIWQNETADKYGNTISLQLNGKKELREQEGKHYIGNAKPAEAKQPEAVAGNEDELNYKGDNIETKVAGGAEVVEDDGSGLPF